MRHHLASSIMTAIVLGLGVTAPAFAFRCPTVIAELQAKLAEAELGDAERAQVEELIAEGQRLHEAGEHQQSLDTLAQAEEMLGG